MKINPIANYFLHFDAKMPEQNDILLKNNKTTNETINNTSIKTQPKQDKFIKAKDVKVDNKTKQNNKIITNTTKPKDKVSFTKE